MPACGPKGTKRNKKKKKNVKGVFPSLHHLFISSSLGETGEGGDFRCKGSYEPKFPPSVNQFINSKTLCHRDTRKQAMLLNPSFCLVPPRKRISKQTLDPKPLTRLV